MIKDNQISIKKIPTLLNKDYQFIDLRDPYEYKKIHLTNFINIPYENFDLNHYHFSKEEPIILICYSGAKSKKLADELCNQGYKAYSIKGGFYTILHPKI